RAKARTRTPCSTLLMSCGSGLRSAGQGPRRGDASGNRSPAERRYSIAEGRRFLLLPGLICRPRGAVIAVEARRRRPERGLVLDQGRGGLPHLGQEIGELLAGWKDRPGRHRMLVRRILELRGRAEERHRFGVL